MRKEEFDKVAAQRPLQPFEVKLVDGSTFTFDNPEKFIVGRSTIATLDERGLVFLINLSLVSTVRVLGTDGTMQLI